jgi:hypothetical protein
LAEEIEGKTAPVPLCPPRTRHKKSFNPMLCGEEPACNCVKAQIITITILIQKYQC